MARETSRLRLRESVVGVVRQSAGRNFRTVIHILRHFPSFSSPPSIRW